MTQQKTLPFGQAGSIVPQMNVSGTVNEPEVKPFCMEKSKKSCKLHVNATKSSKFAARMEGRKIMVRGKLTESKKMLSHVP